MKKVSWLSKVLNWGKTKDAVSSSRSRTLRRLTLENLEERALLTVTPGTNAAALMEPASTEYVVTTLADTTDASDNLLSLREAIAAATDGDSIIFDSSLAGGTITLSGTELTISKGITIDATSIGGMTIDAIQASRVMKISDGTEETPVQLVNLTITGAKYSGIYASCVLTLNNCVITKNTNSGIYNDTGMLTLNGCIITENTNNDSDMGGGGIYNYSGILTMTNCSITNNSAFYGGGLYCCSSCSITLNNCTIAGNIAKRGGGFYNVAGKIKLSVYNSIIAQNIGTGGDMPVSGTVSGYNNISSFTKWDTNTSGNNLVYDASKPLWTAPESNNYTLATGSQAINAGCNDYVTLTTDLAGRTRIDGETVDIGAYEYQTALPPITGISLAGRFAYDGQAKSVTVSGTQDGDQILYSADGLHYSSTPISQTDSGSWNVFVKVTRSGYLDWDGSILLEILPSYVVTTLADVTDNTDGVLSLREAVAAASEGGYITFASELSGGTITLSGSALKIQNGMSIDASSLPDGITIDGNAQDNVFSTSSISVSSVELIHLTIANGSDTSGGGIYNTGKLTLTNCILRNNTATKSGGGIYNTGAMTMTVCLIEGNSATTSGGGIYNSGILTMTNDEITKNTVSSFGGGIYNSGTLAMSSGKIMENSADIGGGINNEGLLTLTNCAITNNLAWTGIWRSAGGLYNKTNAVLRNCTITKNSANSGAGITNLEETSYASGGECILYNTIVAENQSSSYFGDISGTLSGYNNLTNSITRWSLEKSGNNYYYNSLIPLFTDLENGDFTLCVGSQAINIGCNDYVTTKTDLADNTRIIGAAVDLGAYESPFIKTPLAAPTNLTYASYGANRVRLTWDANENAAAYTISYSSDGLAWSEVTTASNSAIITGLTYGTLYAYKVRALAEEGGTYADSEDSAAISYRVCPMDINSDGKINLTDYSLFSASYMKGEGDPKYNFRCNINGIGKVNISDWPYLSQNYGKKADDASLIYPAPLATMPEDALDLDFVGETFADKPLEIEWDLFE